MVTTDGSRDRLLVLEGVTKAFPNGTRALRGVDLAVDAGRVHGLVGANGAGKSTLIKIMSGALSPSAGWISWRGRRLRWHSPKGARQAGIATVYQHTPLVPTLSVLENVFLGRPGGPLWQPGRRAADLEHLFARVGYRLPPEKLVGDLSIGDRQMVAILQAMSEDPALLVLDEPTASLSMSERDVVHKAVRALREAGTGIVYVSHLLDEVMALTDTVTVLRDGRVSLAEATASLPEGRLVQAVAGRALLEREESLRRGQPGADEGRPALLEVCGLSSPGRVAGVGFTVAAGEVVGLAGLLGSGRSEILHAIFGSDPSARGSVRLAGTPVPSTPAGAVRAGIALVPEDRTLQGLVPGWEIWRNMTLPTLRRHSWAGIIPRRREEIRTADDAIETLSIRAPSAMTPVDELSGGNAQKTVFAKWLYEGVRVMLLDEPTAGVDIAAKRDIQVLVRNLAARGAAVVVVDSEFGELLAIADRVLIVRRGQIVGERRASQTSEPELLALASGVAA
jgi:ribose transport system ATP-binding protein